MAPIPEGLRLFLKECFCTGLTEYVVCLQHNRARSPSLLASQLRSSCLPNLDFVVPSAAATSIRQCRQCTALSCCLVPALGSLTDGRPLLEACCTRRANQVVRAQSLIYSQLNLNPSRPHSYTIYPVAYYTRTLPGDFCTRPHSSSFVPSVSRPSAPSCLPKPVSASFKFPGYQFELF